MRNLYILCGAQGTGKSTFIENHKLTNYTLSLDDIRIKLETPTEAISYEHDIKAHKILYELLEYRLAQSQTTFIDSTCILTDTAVTDLTIKYGYTITIIDFRADNLQELLARNTAEIRGTRVVTNNVLSTTFSTLENITGLSAFARISPEEFTTSIDPAIDLSKYNRILISGDWHGNYQEAKQLLDTFNATPQDHIVLLGDYFGKTSKSREMNQLITELATNPNVTLLRGNNDKLCAGCRDYLLMQYHNQNYFLSHAPQTNLPTRLTNGKWLLTTKYPDFNKLHTIYEEWEDIQKDVIHIHGYNNYWGFGLQPRPNIFNLSSDEEFGGTIRALVVTKERITSFAIPSAVETAPQNSVDTVEAQHYLQTQTDEGFTHVQLLEKNPYLLNLETYAQTMLKDGDKIILRGFDKLMNLQHLPGKFRKNLVFPLSIYTKQGGFAGFLSVHNNDFIMTTAETQTEGSLDLFKELLPVFKDSHSELLKALKGHTLAFEVIHADHANNMSLYNGNMLYLQASVNNETGLFNMRSNTTFANYINKYGNIQIIPVKPLTTKLVNLSNLIEFTHIVETSEEPIEGYVVRDQKGFGFTVTTKYFTNKAKMHLHTTKQIGDQIQ